MIVYVTKYALTQGIIEIEVEAVGSGMVKVKDHHVPTYYHKGEWFPTMEAARVKALDLIRRKRDSLKVQFKKLDDLERDIQNQSGYSVAAGGHGVS